MLIKIYVDEKIISHYGQKMPSYYLKKLTAKNTTDQDREAIFQDIFGVEDYFTNVTKSLGGKKGRSKNENEIRMIDKYLREIKKYKNKLTLIKNGVRLAFVQEGSGITLDTLKNIKQDMIICLLLSPVRARE